MTMLVKHSLHSLCRYCSDHLEVRAHRGTLHSALLCAVLLVVQTVHSGIDYQTLGLGWDHPTTRVAYRRADGASFGKSRARQERSKQAMTKLAHALTDRRVAMPAAREALLIEAFCFEIGRPRNAGNATFPAVIAALQAELLLPLRALSEGIVSMTKTFNGAPVPHTNVQVRATSASCCFFPSPSLLSSPCCCRRLCPVQWTTHIPDHFLSATPHSERWMTSSCTSLMAPFLSGGQLLFPASSPLLKGMARTGTVVV